MKKYLLIFLFIIKLMAVESYTEDEIKKLIARTIIIGFDGQKLNNSLKNDIQKYQLGGIILFDKYYKSKKKKILKTQLN